MALCWGVAHRAELIDLSRAALPGLRAMRWWSDAPYAGMKEAYVIGRVESGRVQWWGNGKIWESAPGSMQLKQPGDVHRDVAIDGPVAFQLITLPTALVERAGVARFTPQLDAGDPRGAALERLHAAVRAGADRLALEVAVTEAIDSLGKIGEAASGYTRPVRRAIELLRTRLDEAVTLDDLAAHAGLDKFHLCRAFRAQVGLPPHAYLTQLRIMRAKQLLVGGVKPSDIARQVGLYDQSQLNRHFRRIVGTTPGQYARRG